MILLIVRRFWQTSRRYALPILLCFCVLGLVPAGYGQVDRVSQLISQLKDPDASIRVQAANALGKAKDPRAVEPLITAMKDANLSVRHAAIMALGDIKDPRAADALIAVLKDNPEDNNVIYALWKLKDPRAVDPLLVDLNKMKGSDAFGITDLLKLQADAGFLEDFKDPRVDSALLEALKQPYTAWNMIVISGAYRFFIRRGEPGSEGVLIATLNRFGDEFGDTQMATYFLNCGNLKLEQAARELAQRKGWTLTPITGKESLHWGSSR